MSPLQNKKEYELIIFIRLGVWIARITTGIFILLLILYGISSHYDRNAPINQTTKTCLITGASSGIGRELAHEMITRGWTVIGIARRTQLLTTLQQEFGKQFIPFVCDVADLKQVHTVCEQIKAQELQPTLFFLNAGTVHNEQKWNFSTAAHQKTFATNYFGTIAWIEEWLPSIKKSGATFVATSSLLARLAAPNFEAYTTSKCALVHCFTALSRQYLSDNIGFTVVLPGPVDTEMLRGAQARQLPFIHTAKDEARRIVEGVFAGKKQIEPSWFYSLSFSLLNYLPDWLLIKVL
jgi:short-subunit dehydrogenase